MEILVDQGNMADLEANVGIARSKCGELKEDVAGAATKLRGSWTSDTASQNWTSGQTTWDGACDRLHTELGNLRQKTIEAAERMAAAENRAAGFDW